ncbi:hypothetical protein [Bradyrhizobium sp. WSM1253]|uniref:hypothetical protein n=1 Tax=Bradyrhizobium sp. WSM1253 TaxID=319003 RepID=UPI00025D1856|nr:hypothetical protein [Bradyrhizobium sp. WSM1253]EIG56085.1 hypothetical protein Bra1253DRAFT_00693 [Bradyrhizobium sp. WSM1253]
MMSVGHKYTLVCASLAKRALKREMPAAMRLEFLNHLEKMVDGSLTTEIIAMVEPMDDRGLALRSEAARLGYRGSPSVFDVYAQKFDVFAALNPSLQRAYDAATARYEV